MKFTLFLCVLLVTVCTVFGFYCSNYNQQCGNGRNCCAGLICRSNGFRRTCQRGGGGSGGCINYGQRCDPYNQMRRCCMNRRCRKDFGSFYATCV